MVENEIFQQIKLLVQDVLGFTSALICIFYRVLYVPYLGLRGLIQIIRTVAQWVLGKWKEIFNKKENDGNKKAQDDMKEKTLLQSNACGPFRWIKENDEEKLKFFVDVAKKTQIDVFEPKSIAHDSFSFDNEFKHNDSMWEKIAAQMLKEAESEQGTDKEAIVQQKVLFQFLRLSLPYYSK